jgi:RimJ/RimL family protein N-acetyltransferase
MDIVTDRLRLRLLQADDATWLAREIANPQVQRWLTSPPHPYLISDAVEFIDLNATNSGLRVIVAEETPSGVVSLTRQNGTLQDLGYWLSESAWGNGYMTEAAQALLHWHFSQDEEDITSGWITGNAASRNVLTKLGFVTDGKAQTRSEFQDKHVTVERVRLTAKRWQDLRQAR